MRVVKFRLILLFDNINVRVHTNINIYTHEKNLWSLSYTGSNLKINILMLIYTRVRAQVSAIGPYEGRPSMMAWD